MAEHIITHVFLPPKLPQGDDSDYKHDSALIGECRAALRAFQAHLPSQERWRWVAPIMMLRKMLELRDPSGDMLPEKVEISLETMKRYAEKNIILKTFVLTLSLIDVLAFHIRSQNAGLIVRRLPQKFSFESFELSPTTEAVMTTKGRLRRCFPGPAIAVSQDRVADSSFREALAQLLTELDANTPKEAWPVVKKAHSEAIEVRDSVHPKFITEMLTGILRGIGQSVDVARIHKRTRDDVLWDNAFKPWRRSPLWLLLRVALQTSLMTDTDSPHEWYKSFMIFFMAYILQRALKASLSSDILFVMAAKISRRVLKIGIEDEPQWIRYVRETIEATHLELASRWSTIERNEDPFGTQGAWEPSKLSFSDDIQLTVSTLRPYLRGIATRPTMLSDDGNFRSDCSPRIKQRNSTFPQLDLLTTDGPRLFLADLELWVQDWLGDWLVANQYLEYTCTLLAELIEKYSTTAAFHYAKNPEDTSLMLLTSIELWVALDKCATRHHPLLSKFDPGFPPSLFNPLLLPKKLQMERLLHVEQYLTQRRDKSIHDSCLIFQDINARHSLAVQYFEQSMRHQSLRREIETAADIEREQKRRELGEKRREYHRLKQESDSMSCDNTTEWNGYRQYSYHNWNCRKCEVKNRAENLQITVHEWPLPESESEAKSAVFELDVPTVIAEWRDVTYTLLVDVFSPPMPQNHQQGAKKLYSLQGFSGLSKYARSRAGRLQLMSTAKPFVEAHYGDKEVTQATEDNICVNNGLRYSMYDSTSKERTTELLNRCSVQKLCTFQLSSESYRTLQFALDKTTHTSNEVLAKQAECPKALNLHEFYAFATLRSGDRLQWRNIARELVSRVLSFSHDETYALVVQAAWQAGRPGDGGICRESHFDLEEKEFGLSLLSVLEEALESVEGNWQGAVAVRTFIALATRLLSMSACSTVYDGCYLFLRRARKITLQWTRDVGQLLHEGQGAEELKMLNLRVLEMALTCHGTFDVDKHHLSALLGSEEDIATITECFITAHDRCPAVTESIPQFLKTQLQRYERLCHFLEPALRTRILAQPGGLDTTVRRVWAGYHPGSSWATMESPSDRWLVTKTSGEGGYSTMTVHYNVLDGSLLVNGSLLTRLPRSYELHATYRRLFGEKVLDVVPTTMPGMVFETRNEICGQQVYFRMYDSELIIRTRRQRQVLEVLPIHALHNDFPTAFVQDYTHWLDTDTNLIEWRPLRNAWTSSPDNWQMQADDQKRFVLSYGAKRLIDVRSPTANAISQVLSPLESATHVHILLNCRTGALEVNLPRLKLEFRLKQNGSLLESKQFRGMVVDERQSFGALTGLVNKLVLREAEGSSRSVIVPHGSVSFLPDGHHVRVMINTTSAVRVKYHSYHIDSQLGRLVDNGSLKSRLFRLYLHATTAHCLIDELTGRTGTEEALYGLAGAASRSFVELEPVHAELLETLARLTPRRQYYPEHLRVMQQVDWKTLSPLSQHCAFYKHVASILNQAKSFQIFQENPVQLPFSGARGEVNLLERAAIRDSSFQVDGFGAEVYTTSYDITYSSRDQFLDGPRELQTCCTAKLVDDWSTKLAVCPQLLSEIESWDKPLCGPVLEDDLVLGFDPKWLNLPATFLPDYWCAFHNILSKSVVEQDKYKIMIFLSTLSYSQQVKQVLVHTLLAFATIAELRILQPPDYSGFQLADGYKPVRKKLASMTEVHVRQFHDCPESHLPNLYCEDWRVADARRRQKHQVAKEEQIRMFADDLMAQWPKVNISVPSNTNHSTYILVDEATASARVSFQSWHRNAEFQEYTKRAQIILNGLTSVSQNLQQYSFSPPTDGYVSKKTHVNFNDLTSNCALCLAAADLGDFNEWIVLKEKENTSHSKLGELLDRVLSQCTHVHEQRYAGDLVKSFEALREDTSVELRQLGGLIELLEAYLMQAKLDVDYRYQMLCIQLQTGARKLVRIAQMLPRLSPISILSLLANDKVTALPNDWKRSLVLYGLSIANLQRAQRLIASAENEVELLGELENPGHRDWDPMCHPEWLLLEIENNILIRQEQAQIAREMVSPSSESNSVMQLNMGLGKSSVIVPIAAVALADRTQLVRVIVLRPLAMQMFHLLAKKLGGMLNRRLYYMPISRSLKLNVPQARQIYDLYKECMDTGGVLLTQPEHVLSFELMGLERLVSGNLELGNIMIQTQAWLQTKSRDILDESDEILSVRFELIYTMGMQRAIEFSPDRWAIVQHVLRLLGCFAHQIHNQFPHGLEVAPAQPGSFPRIRILQTLAGDKLLESAAKELCEFGLPGVPVWNLPPKVRTALFGFLTDPKLSAIAAQSVYKAAFGSESMKNGLLLLKGLFADGILRFALKQKRWRVNYGLDPSRTMLAVPFHAKDSPATRAEFSHPDATIVLTCLSYYYGGLSDQQIYNSFEALLKLDHAPQEYARWVQDAPELPTAFRQITGINLSNTEQCSQEVFPPLRFARSIINFYTSTFVFPTEMKEFPRKLSSSGWDIAREKAHPTTGFSGTNDSRYVLPLSITQCDLPSQLPTNAKVLDCLLRHENSFVDVRQASESSVLNAEVLLEMALTLDPPVRVILDVGAQVLELQNEEMARAWLSRVPESAAQAVIFFNSGNQIYVLSHDGTTEPLLISPFAKQIDQCLVYLDEAHTRGTDLRLPTNYRAIVTLGPGLTKDRLVQACMRMRKLGKGQSVVFCSSMEVQREILESSGKSREAIEVADVLKWCIAGTCASTRKSIPLWATQGLRHQRRHAICSQSWSTPEEGLPRHLAESLLEKEAQSLQERYGSKGTRHEEQIFLQKITEEPLKSRKKQLAAIRAKCQEFGVGSFNTATLQEEQERELSPENEREQQVEFPPAATPCKHSVHKDVRRLVTHGDFIWPSSAFQPAFDTLSNTTASNYYDKDAWPDGLLVTTDFAQTVQASSNELLDSFLRPVHWVVSFKNGDRLGFVVLSPYEAQELLPSIRQHKRVSLHVYSPRLNVSLRTLEDLSFCAIPAVPESWSSPSTATLLNLFAGQLYIRTYEEYESLCSFLGLSSHPPGDHIEVACDGFISPPNRAKSDSTMVRACAFTTSPVAFLRMVIALRRKGQSFTNSHLGMILNGELISREHF